jgi:hypothetical protein
MEILNLSGNNGHGKKKNSKFRAFIGIGVIAAAVGLSSTLAANISINSGPVEFGQGVAQTVACSGDESIIVTPATSFSNEGADINTFFVGADSGRNPGEGWLEVVSTDGINVGMVVTAGDGWIAENTVVIEIDGERNVYISNEPQGPGILPPGIAVTFSESRGTPVTRTPGGSSPYSPGSLFEIDTSGLTIGMLVSGVGIAADTVITQVDPAGEILTSKPDTYSGGDPLTFTNSVSGVQGSFKLSDITVSGIPDTCNGKVFTIKLYDNESTEPLRISDFGNEDGDSSVQVWWANGYESGGRAQTEANEAVVQFPADYRVWPSYLNADNDGNRVLETAASPDSTMAGGAFKINLPVSVDASRVYKITVESQDDSDSLNVSDDEGSFYDWYISDL